MNVYLPIALIAASTTLYHFAQKSVPMAVNPIASLAMNYLTALAGTIVLLPFFRTGGGGFMGVEECELGEYRGGHLYHWH